MRPTLCARLDDPSGSLNAHFGPQGTTFGRQRRPLRQVRLQYHRCPAGLSQPLGCCHGPEAWRSSTRPVWRHGCRVSASAPLRRAGRSRHRCRWAAHIRRRRRTRREPAPLLRRAAGRSRRSCWPGGGEIKNVAYPFDVQDMQDTANGNQSGALIDEGGALSVATRPGCGAAGLAPPWIWMRSWTENEIRHEKI